MIYLDNSATTRPCPACVRAMTEALTDCWGNPSSVYALGIDAAHRLRQARQAVAAALIDTVIIRAKAAGKGTGPGGKVRPHCLRRQREKRKFQQHGGGRFRAFGDGEGVF